MTFDSELSYYTKTRGLGTFQTFAQLSNARRIQASVGTVGRSRSPSYVAGLRFDYYGQTSSAILGQWMEESDTVELSKGEFVQRITVWLDKEDVSIIRPDLRLGQVAALKFDTTRGRHIMFQPPGNSSLPARIHAAPISI